MCFNVVLILRVLTYFCTLSLLFFRVFERLSMIILCTFMHIVCLFHILLRFCAAVPFVCAFSSFVCAYLLFCAVMRGSSAFCALFMFSTLLQASGLFPFNALVTACALLFAYFGRAYEHL